MIVHGLRNGFPLCNFMRELPVNWPEGHMWTYPDPQVTCEGCKDVLHQEAKAKAGATPTPPQKTVWEHLRENADEDSS